MPGVKNLPSRGLPVRVVIPVVLCIAVVAAVPIVSFLKTGFGTSGSSISTTEITTPPPAIAEALTELRSRIAKNPRDAEALSSLAGLYAQIGKTDEAAKLEGQAVAATPNDVALREAYAALLRGSGKFHEAIAQIDAIIALNPQNADAYFERATLDSDLHNSVALRKDMQHFLDVAPTTDTRRPIAKATLKSAHE